MVARIYRGWPVVLGCLAVAMLVVGICSHSYGLFIVPVSRDLGLNRADANNGLILASLGAALFAPFAGRLIDRVSAQKTVAVGCLVFAAALLAIAGTSSPWVIALMAIGPVAFALEFIGGILVTTVATRWFQRRQGLVLGIMAIAATGGGVVVAPLTASLIEQHGWRMALVILAALCAGVALLASWFVIRSWPAAGEMEAAGEAMARDEPDHACAPDRVWTIRELLKNRNFLLIAFATSLLLANFRVVITSLAPHLADQGVGLKQAALMISMATGAPVIGKLACGYLSDRIDPRRILLAVVAGHVCLLLLLLANPTYDVLMIGIALIGIPVGGTLPVQGVLLARNFGRASFGTAFAIMGLVFQPITIVTLRWSGMARDRSGHYDLAFESMLAVVALSLVMALLIRPPVAVPSSPEATV